MPPPSSPLQGQQRPKLNLAWLPSGLQRLHMRGVEVAINAVCSDFPCLTHLDLRNCWVVDFALFGPCPKLEYFRHDSLNGCR